MFARIVEILGKAKLKKYKMQRQIWRCIFIVQMLVFYYYERTVYERGFEGS